MKEIYKGDIVYFLFRNELYKGKVEGYEWGEYIIDNIFKTYPDHAIMIPMALPIEEIYKTPIELMKSLEKKCNDCTKNKQLIYI